MNFLLILFLISALFAPSPSPPFIRFGVHSSPVFKYGGNRYTRERAPYEINRIGLMKQYENQENEWNIKNKSQNELEQIYTLYNMVRHDNIKHIKRLIDLINKMQDESLRSNFF